MKDMVTEQKKKKTIMQLAFSVKSCLLIRKQRTGWDKCMNVKGGLMRACARIGDRVDDYVCGFWTSNKAKLVAFTFRTVDN
jgi:hypothetical protein